MEGLGLSTKDDVTSDLRPTRMKKNAKDLATIKCVLKGTMNPFTVAEKDFLYNLSSGKGASEKTTYFFTNAETIGEQRRDEFIDECCADQERFENRITREKTLSTFANEGVTKKSMKDNKEMHQHLTKL